ncbi:uncharacterized protein [Typha latifolia]|uniref:uncharacterized protein n=1 Tax=Typha latifolia TaxID=4733 RepID=UPI003C302F91
MSSPSSSSSTSSSQSSSTLALDMKGTLLVLLLLLSFFLFPLSILTVLFRATLRTATPFNIARNNLLSWLLDSALLSGDRRRVVSGHGKLLGVVRYEREKAGSPSEPVECVICLCGIEEGKEIRELRCNHLFHRSCLDRWLEQQFTCPLCRDPLCTSTTPREGDQVMMMMTALERDEEEVEDPVVLLVAHVSNGWWPS